MEFGDRSFVLDASVVAKWFTQHHEDDRDKALELRRMHEHGRARLVVPEYSLLEVINAIRYSSKSQEQDAQRALDDLEKIDLKVVPVDWDHMRRGVFLSWRYGLAIYDAAYVALAENLSIPFVTADEAMYRRLRGHEQIVRLADLNIGDS